MRLRSIAPRLTIIIILCPHHSAQIEAGPARLVSEARNKQQSTNKWLEQQLVTYDLDTNTIPSGAAVAEPANTSDKELNLEQAGDANRMAGIGPDMELMELLAGGGLYEHDEPDPDIRSIMEANDGLVRELLSVVNSGDWQKEWGSASDQADQEGGDDNDDEGTANSIETEKPRLDEEEPANGAQSSEEPDYELQQLADLVRETIEDYAHRLDAFEQHQLHDAPKSDDIRSLDGLLGGGFVDKISEVIKNTTELLIEQNKANSSSSFAADSKASRPRRSHDAHRSGRRGKLAHSDINRLCPSSSDSASDNDDKDKPAAHVYRDCSQMPECESGGQCVEELATSGARQIRSGARLRKRARCRCPIGRGGQLCQKRKSN